MVTPISPAQLIYPVSPKRANAMAKNTVVTSSQQEEHMATNRFESDENSTFVKQISEDDLLADRDSVPFIENKEKKEEENAEAQGHASKIDVEI